jgi:hypothetical protein
MASYLNLANSAALISYNAGLPRCFLNISLGTFGQLCGFAIQILCGFHKPRRLIPFNAAVIMARVYFIILLPIP